jgi:ubiquinone/menaquinone biosynthesis C-methylase UbiE
VTDRGYIVGNRATWEEWSATFTAQREHAWPSDELAWGIWQVAEQSVGALPRDVSGMQAVELGCGTGRVSAWLARQGARTVAIDFSPNQLRAVRRLQARHGVEFALCEANAEELPFGDERFDLAVSDYGASIWSDPYLWIPEASRVLRPGGQLTFLVNGTIALLASPDAPTTLAEQRLHRDYFGMHRIEWPDWPWSSPTSVTAT